MVGAPQGRSSGIKEIAWTAAEFKKRRLQRKELQNAIDIFSRTETLHINAQIRFALPASSTSGIPILDFRNTMTLS